MVAIAAFTSFGTTSPRYNMQQAMYFPMKEYVEVKLKIGKNNSVGSLMAHNIVLR
jgi:hypothetical protein